MPQGAPARVPTPAGVLLFDPLSNDDGGLLASSDNVIQRFGLLRSRPGLQAMGVRLAAGDIALGGFWVRDKAGDVQFYVGTNRRLYHFNRATRVFDDLKTGGAPTLTGSIACPTTFTYFEQGDFQYAIAVNGVDAAIEHQIGTNTYALVATGYIARSVCTVANRLFYGNMTIGAVRFPTMVAWSAAGLRDTNPALARQKLIDSGEHIIAVRRGNRKSVYIYRENSIWIGSVRVASDAQAFAFDIAAQGPGPVGEMAIGEDPGFRQMYLGGDLNLWLFDGTNQAILAPTAGILQNRFNPALGALVSCTYDQISQELIVSLPLDGDTLPLHELRYSFITHGIFPALWNRLYPVTMLAAWQVEIETTTCQLPDVPTCELPDVPTCQLGFTTGQPVVVIGASDFIATHEGSDDNGEAIDTVTEVLMPIRPGGEYEFDSVEIQGPSSCPPITVSVLVGNTFDTATTEITLGVIDPSITPPPYGSGPMEDTAAGPNLSRVVSDDVLRGRIVIVRLRCVSPQQLAARRIELTMSPRRRLA
jgi:hypothetical protein